MKGKNTNVDWNRIERKERNGTGWSKIEQKSKSETGFSFPAHMN